MVRFLLSLAILGGSTTVPPPVQDAVPQVVAVWSVDGAGSGFPVGEDLVVTALHVTGDRTGAQLRLQDGSVVGGQVIASSKSDDLALIRANLPVFEPLALASGTPPAPANVWAIGDPPDDDAGALLRPGSTLLNATGLDGYLHFTADVRQGFSGGPVVNELGEVVGVIDAKTLDGEALAVPVAAVSALIASVGEDAVPAGGRPWQLLLLVGILTAGSVLFVRRVRRRDEVTIRLGSVRHTAAAARLEEP